MTPADREELVECLKLLDRQLDWLVGERLALRARVRDVETQIEHKEQVRAIHAAKLVESISTADTIDTGGQP